MFDILLRRVNELERRLQALEIADGAPNALVIVDGVTAPVAVVGLAQIYVDTADGDLKVKFGDGITKTLATDI